MFGVGGVLFIPISGLAAYALVFELPPPQGAIQWGVRFILEELAIGSTLFFTLGFAWAITGAQGLKRQLDSIAIRLAWIAIPSAVFVFMLTGLIALVG